MNRGSKIRFVCVFSFLACVVWFGQVIVAIQDNLVTWLERMARTVSGASIPFNRTNFVVTSHELNSMRDVAGLTVCPFFSELVACRSCCGAVLCTRS